MDGIKYQYTWFWHLDSGEYIILRVTEEAQEGGKLYFDTLEEAKDYLIRHLTDCISDAFDEITTLSEEIFSLTKKVQQANVITDDLVHHLTDCVSDAFDEIEMLSKEIFSLGEKIQKANDITTWTESE